jgi:hypothetical protein
VPHLLSVTLEKSYRRPLLSHTLGGAPRSATDLYWRQVRGVRRAAERDLPRAISLFRQIRDSFERVLGPRHPATAAVRSDLAALLLAAGQPVEALAVAESALAVFESRDGPYVNDIDVDSARVSADALDALGRTDEAKALRERYGLREAVEKPKGS